MNSNTIRSALRLHIHKTFRFSSRCLHSDNRRFVRILPRVSVDRNRHPCTMGALSFQSDVRRKSTQRKINKQTKKITEVVKSAKKMISSDTDANDISLIASIMTKHQTSTQTESGAVSEGTSDEVTVLRQRVEQMNMDITDLRSALHHQTRSLTYAPQDDHSPASDEDFINNEEFVEELSLDTGVNKTWNRSRREYTGTCDPDSEISSVPCPGCGAFLHCKEIAVPGYMPSERYKSIPKSELREQLCQRCFLMTTYNIALKAKVSADEYPRIISQIRHVQKALVLVVVDLTDLPNSIYKETLKLIGNHPVYIIGNKVDLLPKDEFGYLERTKEMLKQECLNAGFSESRIKHVSLISGKTGYGVEELVTKLMNDWALKGNVYVVGCTNVGKSTIYNALLSSDYCKSRASDHIRRATTSIWPGTTLNLLKFPIVTPTPWRLMKRTKRLLKERASHVEERRLRQKKLKDTGNPKYATLIGYIGQTFKPDPNKEDYEGHTLSTYKLSTVGHIQATQTGKEAVLPQKEKYREDLFYRSSWCHDTPGVINSEQIINLLTQEELAVLLSKRIIKPRTFVIKPTQVLFVSGLGRIDYVQGPVSMYMTVFSCTTLPVHVMNQEDADQFYQENIGTSQLMLPIGDPDRLNRLPSLVGREFELTGVGWNESVADVTLSSVGWVAMTAGTGMKVKVRAFTPGGAGVTLRTPSLLRYAIRLKGKRIGKSPVYEVRKANYKMHLN